MASGTPRRISTGFSIPPGRSECSNSDVILERYSAGLACSSDARLDDGVTSAMKASRAGAAPDDAWDESAWIVSVSADFAIVESGHMACAVRWSSLTVCEILSSASWSTSAAVSSTTSAGADPAPKVTWSCPYWTRCSDASSNERDERRDLNSLVAVVSVSLSDAQWGEVEVDGVSAESSGVAPV